MQISRAVKGAAVAAVLAVTSTSAFAGVISYSTTIATSAVSFSQSLSLQKFDTSLGTLTGVTLGLTNNATANVDVANFTAFSQAFINATAAIPVTLTGPDGSFVSATATAGPFNNTAAPGLNAFSGLTATNSNTFSVLPANWSSYEGLGFATAAFIASATTGVFSGSSVPGVFFGGSANAGGTATVTYTYTTSEVPEPATMAILGAGLLGLGTARRRRA
jgi:hypothetical protein